MNHEELKKILARRATFLEVGGFRPVDDPFASWIGKVTLGLPGEEWPVSNGKPMIPLLQLNLLALPYLPKILEDIAMITVFMDSENLPANDEPNGEGWCLRAYHTLEGLTALTQAKYRLGIKAFQLRPDLIEDDFPCREDIPWDLHDQIPEDYRDEFDNCPGLKVGGWPTLIQGEIFWAPNNLHPANPEFAFQIDSDPKANWSWGHGGVGYFGRGTAEGQKDVWCIAWDSF